MSLTSLYWQLKGYWRESHGQRRVLTNALFYSYFFFFFFFLIIIVSKGEDEGQNVYDSTSQDAGKKNKRRLSSVDDARVQVIR